MCVCVSQRVCVCVADVPAGEPGFSALHGEPDVERQDVRLRPGLQAQGGGRPPEGPGAGERHAQTEGSAAGASVTPRRRL